MFNNSKRLRSLPKDDQLDSELAGIRKWHEIWLISSKPLKNKARCLHFRWFVGDNLEIREILTDFR